MTRYLSNGLGSAALCTVVAILAAGCNHPHSKDDGNTVASPVSQLSPSLAGKRITIRGELFMFKCGQGIQLEDGDVICLVGMPPNSGSADPYAGLSDKPLEVTGTLRFFHDSTPLDETRPLQREHDHYYFEKETTQVRIMTEYIDNAKASSAGSQLSQALVGKRVTIRGKLLGRVGLKCGPGIELDDRETICLENTHPKRTFPGMFDKRVEATGTLGFFHDSTPRDENIPAQRIQDYYYFEAETAQVRLVAQWQEPQSR